MRRFSNGFFSTATFIILAGTFVLISPRTGHARPSMPVEVVNTPTVNVGNTETNPVPIRNVNDAMQPFQKRLTFDIVSGSTQNQVSLDVPIGKRLVIEHVSARAQGPTGQQFIAQIQSSVLTNGSDRGVHWLELMFQGTFSNMDIFTTSQPMRVYADPSFPPVLLIVTRTVPTGDAFGEVTISGYLVAQ